MATVSENPARVAGLRHVGAIQVGRRADLLLLRADLSLHTTIVAGRMAYQAGPQPTAPVLA